MDESSNVKNMKEATCSEILLGAMGQMFAVAISQALDEEKAKRGTYVRTDCEKALAHSQSVLFDMVSLFR